MFHSDSTIRINLMYNNSSLKADSTADYKIISDSKTVSRCRFTSGSHDLKPTLLNP